MIKNSILCITFFCHQLLAQHTIDSTGTILIGGIKQYVAIKAKDDSKPLLLFLHGGPGNSVMHYAEKFTDKLQEHFIVVQWEQRETGKTLAINKSREPLTVSLFQQDVRELIDSLLNRFGQRKLYLVGHSWGTVLGFFVAKNHPDLLHAYIPICPMVNQLDSERVILETMIDGAKKNGNKLEIQELATVKIPFENGEQLYFHRKWLLNFMGSKTKISKTRVEEWSSVWLSLFNEASKDNLLLTTPSLHCPVYFFVGRRDYQTNSTITEKYYQQLVAPKKGLFWFEHSAHALPSSEPQLLQKIIIEKVARETRP